MNISPELAYALSPEKSFQILDARLTHMQLFNFQKRSFGSQLRQVQSDNPLLSINSTYPTKVLINQQVELTQTIKDKLSDIEQITIVNEEDINPTAFPIATIFVIVQGFHSVIIPMHNLRATVYLKASDNPSANVLTISGHHDDHLPPTQSFQMTGHGEVVAEIGVQLDYDKDTWTISANNATFTEITTDLHCSTELNVIVDRSIHDPEYWSLSKRINQGYALNSQMGPEQKPGQLNQAFRQQLGKLMQLEMSPDQSLTLTWVCNDSESGLILPQDFDYPYAYQGNISSLKPIEASAHLENICYLPMVTLFSPIGRVLKQHVTETSGSHLIICKSAPETSSNPDCLFNRLTDFLGLKSALIKPNTDFEDACQIITQQNIPVVILFVKQSEKYVNSDPQFLFFQELQQLIIQAYQSYLPTISCTNEPESFAIGFKHALLRLKQMTTSQLEVRACD